MVRSTLIVSVLAFSLTGFVAAQGEKPATEVKPPPGVEPAMPTPGPQHEHLKQAAGTWDAVVEMEGMPPSKGVSVMKITKNGFWLVDDFKGDFGGMAFEGQGTTGYDPIKGKFVATWIDNMSPALMVMEGSFDEKTKTLNMTGDGYDMQGNKVKVRESILHQTSDLTVFQMFQTGADGKEARLMKITYTRRK